MALGIGDLVANLRMNTAGFTRGAKMATASMRGLDRSIVSKMQSWGKEAQLMSRRGETASQRFTRRLTELKVATKAGDVTMKQYTATVTNLKVSLLAAANAEQLATRRRKQSSIATIAAAKAERLAIRQRRRARVVSGARTGLRAAVLPVTAVVVATAGAARISESFNQAMNSSLAIMKDVNAEMRDDMKRTAFDIARFTKFSGAEAAESYFFLASAGLDAAQSLKALPLVAQFAQAGMFDMARATDLLTDAQSALGKTVKDPIKNLKNMTKISDILVKANTLANASVEQFSEALTNKAAAAMRLVNMETEAGVAVLAAFADQGIKGSEAGTAFSIVMRDLTTKAIKQREEFKALGVNVFDSSGKFRNMADIVGDLEVALFGLSAEQKKATLLQLGFSDKSVQFTQVLLGQSQAIRDYEEEIRKAGGTTKDVADNQLTPLRKGIEAVQAVISAFSVDAMTGPLADLGKAMEDSAQKGGTLEGFLDGFGEVVTDAQVRIAEFVLANKAFARTLEGDFEGVAAIRLQITRGRELRAEEKEKERQSRLPPKPLTAAENQAKIFKEAQEHAIRAQRMAHQQIRQLDAQAGNQQRAKDMELLKENQKAADKVREAFSNPLQDFLDTLKDLQQLRQQPGGLTEAEFQRAKANATATAIAEMEREKTPQLTDAQRSAQDIVRGLRSPVDVLIDEMSRIKALVKSGDLSAFSGEAAIEKLQKDFREGEAVTPTAGRIAEFGTDEAFQAILAATRDEDAAKRTAENTKKAAEALENIDQNIAAVEALDILG